MKSTATINPVLSTQAYKFASNRAEFAGLALFPIFMTGEQSSDYYVFDAENMLNIPRNIQRAPGAPYSRSIMKLSDDNYATREYGHEEPVDDRERKKYASAFDADVSAVERITNIILTNHELRAYAKATSGSVASSSPGTKWNANGADPIGDLSAAREIIHDKCGLDPNTLVIGRSVFNVLKELDVILQKIKYVQKGIVTADLLAAVFGVERVIVAGAVTNTAQEGQTISPAKIWGDSVILAHTNTAQNLKAPNFGRTFVWTGNTGSNGIAVRSYRDEPINSDVHRAWQDTDEKLVGAECGYHLSDVLS